MDITNATVLFGNSVVSTSCGLLMRRYFQTPNDDLPPLYPNANDRNLSFESEQRQSTQIQQTEATFDASQNQSPEIERLKNQLLKAERANARLKKNY